VRALKRAASCNKGSTALQLKGIPGASGLKSTTILALKTKCGLENKEVIKILRLTKQHEIQRISRAKEYIEKYSNQVIILSDEIRFCFKGPDGYFKAWLVKDDSYQVRKDIF